MFLSCIVPSNDSGPAGCVDLKVRGPRIIAVAGNLGDLWGEQHRIETRTKPNHSWVNSGLLTIGGNYSRSPLAYSAETLLFSIIARCLRYVGEPVDVRAGLLSKGHVWAIISCVCLEMDEIKKENELWREAKIVTKAAHLGLALQASHFSRGTWIACCPGKNQ